MTPRRTGSSPLRRRPRSRLRDPAASRNVAASMTARHLIDLPAARPTAFLVVDGACMRGRPARSTG